MKSTEPIRPSTVAVIAGMIVAVKFARLDIADGKLMNSPMASSILMNSITLARRIVQSTYDKF